MDDSPDQALQESLAIATKTRSEDLDGPRPGA